MPSTSRQYDPRDMGEFQLDPVSREKTFRHPGRTLIEFARRGLTQFGRTIGVGVGRKEKPEKGHSGRSAPHSPP